MEQVVAEALRRSYGDTAALKGVSVAVEEGEIFALVGPNGAGKTTLVRCLTRTLEPDEGEARILGQTPDEVDRSRIGVLPQNFEPSERLTVEELVGYYGSLYTAGERRDVDPLLEEMGVADASCQRYSELSGGQKSRVRVASALVNDPEVLFLDEPTTGIDPEGREDVWTAVERLAAEGTTVFLTTHYMREVERLADRVALMSGGEVVETGSTDEIVRSHGGEPRLVVRTVGPAEDAVTLLEETDTGTKPRVEGEEIQFEGVPVGSIGEVLESLDGAGVEYDEVRWKEPDLEDAYLALTSDARRESVRQEA